MCVLPFAVPEICPRTSVKEMFEDLNPTVFRFAMLLPTTLRPWLFVASPDRPVENVVSAIVAIVPFQKCSNIDEFFHARELCELCYEFRAVLRIERVLTFELRYQQ